MTYWKLSEETKVMVGGRSAYREDRKQVSLEIRIRGDDKKRERERVREREREKKKIKLTWDRKEKRGK